MKLQKSSLFGLLAVLELAGSAEQHLSVGEIADRYAISSHHLAKVMRNLSRAGLAQSVPGPGGGYKFAGNAKRTTMLDIVRLFEPMGPGSSSVDDEVAPSMPIAMAIESVRGEIDELIQATLQSITISSLLKISRRQDRPCPTE